MNRDLEGIGASFAFSDVAAGIVDYMTVCAVPWPAWVEIVSVQTDGAPITLMLSAVRMWLPDRVGVAAPAVVEGERILGGRGNKGATDAGQRVIVWAANQVVTLYVGKLVRWAPWYLRLACRQFTAVPPLVEGVVYMRRAVDAEQLSGASRWSRGRWDPRFAGYRSAGRG